MSEHEEKLKQERRLLVQRTADVHLVRVTEQTAVQRLAQADSVYLPESEARRLAANGSVMIVKDAHGKETIREAV